MASTGALAGVVGMEVGVILVGAIPVTDGVQVVAGEDGDSQSLNSFLNLTMPSSEIFNLHQMHSVS